MFAAWTAEEAKLQWFHGATAPIEYRLDFRVNGTEINRVKFDDGSECLFTATYHDIVPNERIAYSYTLDCEGDRLSLSVVTVEFVPQQNGTLLTYTEQGAYFDGLDEPANREAGTKSLLEKLAEVIDVQVTEHEAVAK